MLRFPAAFVGALVALVALSSMAGAQERLWRDAAGRAPILDAEEWRGRAVRTDGAEWLATALHRRVELELFDGEVIRADLTRRGSASPGAVIWYGRIEGAGADDHVILAWRDGAIAATVSLGERLVRLRGDAFGTILTEARPDAFAPCATDQTGSDVVLEPSERQVDSATVTPPGAFASTATIMVDVLTAWTPAARQAAGGTNQILALIDLAVAEANLSYKNCGAGMYMRLVHAAEVQYTESGSMSTDLSRLRSTNDGHMDIVHTWRNQYGADAVSLITNTGSACGQGYLMTNVSQSFQSSAFNVTRRSCATGNYTYAHEFGHNFGCAHDPENAGSASHNYAYGYRTPGNLYRTVMAYAPGSRKPIFSSPLHTWNGLVMGTALQDNARALTTNAPVIGNWRQTQVPFEDCDGNGIPDEVQIAAGGDKDGDGVLDVCQSLAGDTPFVSMLTGGVQNLTLDAGPEHAGRIYVMLGSLAGKTPATSLFGLELPLAFDSYFLLTLNQQAGALLTPSIGILDAQGRASAKFQIPPFLSFPLLATPAHHAYGVLDAALTPVFASNAVRVQFVVL